MAIPLQDTPTTGRWQRVTRSNPCPVCGKGHNCEVNGSWIRCRRVESDKPLSNGAGWLHYLGDEKSYTPPPITVHTGRQKADIDTRHKVYSALLKELSLSAAHRKHLLSQKRQLNAEQIRRRGYKTLPGPGRSAICKRLREQFDDKTLLSVPGFYVSHKGRYGAYLTLAGAAGILLPFRDTQGRIAGFQVKPDNGGKYLWLSSNGKDGGTGIGGDGLPAHVSRPGELRGHRVFITEGPLKADIAADRLGETVVAVPGVGTWEGANVLGIVDKLAASEVIVAYDADADTKPQVRAAQKALACALVAAGYTTHIARWDESQGKGIDDLLLNGGAFTLERWHDTGDSKLVRLPADVVPLSKKHTQATIEQARQIHEREIMRRILNPEPGALFIESSTGTGKTTSALNCLKKLRSRGWPTKPTGTGRQRPLRVAFVVDQRTKVAELLEERAEMRDAIGDGFAAVRLGRDGSTNCRSDFDAIIKAYGARRHRVGAEVCSGCAMRDTCKYWADVKQSRKAPVVLATKDSLFNNPKDLADFDVVIVDERLDAFLFESVTVGLDELLLWMQGMNRLRAIDADAYTEDNPLRRLTSLLQSVLTLPVDRNKDWHRLMPELVRIAGGRDELQKLLWICQGLKPNSYGRYDFEEPAGDEFVPLRLMADLVRLLAEEVQRPEGADTRLWRTAEGLRVVLFKKGVADVLRNRVLINLDATPAPGFDRLFSGAVHINFEVPAEIEVTQIRGPLLTQRSLERPETFKKVNRALEAVTADAVQPAVFSHKAFNPDASGKGITLSNPNTAFGHYGAHRATNRDDFMTADVLALVGLFAVPPPETRALVQAARNSADAVTTTGDTRTLKPYEHIDDTGSAWGLRVPCDPDPEVQNALNHQIRADIVQAIGRARAGLRDENVRVFLFTGWPVDGLRVDHLVTLDELAGVTPRTPPQAINTQRQTDAQAKVQKAIADLEADGQHITETAVRNKSGVRRLTVKAYLEKFYMAGGDDRNHKDIELVRNSVVPPPHIESETAQKPAGTRRYTEFAISLGTVPDSGAEIVPDRVLHEKPPPGSGPFWMPPGLEGLALVDWLLVEAVREPIVAF